MRWKESTTLIHHEIVDTLAVLGKDRVDERALEGSRIHLKKLAKTEMTTKAS